MRYIFIHKLVLEAILYDEVINWASRCRYIFNRYTSSTAVYQTRERQSELAQALGSYAQCSIGRWCARKRLKTLFTSTTATAVSVSNGKKWGVCSGLGG